jgi:hypothetical protein
LVEVRKMDSFQHLQALGQLRTRVFHTTPAPTAAAAAANAAGAGAAGAASSLTSIAIFPDTTVTAVTSTSSRQSASLLVVEVLVGPHQQQMAQRRVTLLPHVLSIVEHQA